MPLITRFLDTKTPTLEWQSFGVPSVESDTFRLTYAGTPANFNQFQGWLLIRCVYRDGSFSPQRRLYPTPGTQIIELPAPEELKNSQGKLDRIWQIKRGQRYWRNPLGASPVTVTLEEVTGVDEE